MKRESHTKADLLGYLREQITFLRNSTNAYDKGLEGEAVRLAATIRVLVHDTKESTSLLASLHKKDIQFYDSGSDWESDHTVSLTGLANIKFSPTTPMSGLEFYAPLDDLQPGRSKDKKVSFDKWWNKVIYLDKKQQLNRKELILNTANKLGGTHVDPNLDEAYRRLKSFDSPAWKFISKEVAFDSSGSEFTVKETVEDSKTSLLLANIRQVAHEVLKTLQDEFPELF